MKLFLASLLVLPSLPSTGISQGTCADPFAENLGGASLGSAGVPLLGYGGSPLVGNPFVLELGRGAPGAAALVLASLSASPVFLPPFQATLFPSGPFLAQAGLLLDEDGAATSPIGVAQLSPALCGVSLFCQAIVIDAEAAGGAAFSNALQIGIGEDDGGPLFGTAQTFFGDTFHPTELTTGDVDLDGIADVVMTNAGTDDLSIFLGLGDGSFAEVQKVAAVTVPTSVAIADLNEDGLPDLAVSLRDTGTNRAVGLYLGAGDGTFGPLQTLGGGSGEEVVVADLNSDGIPDLVVALTLAEVNVYLGLGSGVFAPAQGYAGNALPQSVAVGDLSGDDVPDLAFVSAISNDLTVWFGVGDGTFEDTQAYPAGGSFPSCVVMEDVDGDGLQDLVVANSASDHLSVFLGVGGGQLAPSQNVATGDHPEDVSVEDFDGDGVLDLAVTLYYSEVSVHLGVGNGTFEEPILLGPGASPVCVVSGDLDGDGMPDLAVSSSDHVDGDLTVYSNQLLE